jgi:hypothetical protein
MEITTPPVFSLHRLVKSWLTGMLVNGHQETATNFQQGSGNLAKAVVVV